jgi:hypothetical protein
MIDREILLQTKYDIQQIIKESSFRTKLLNDTKKEKNKKRNMSSLTTQENIIKEYLKRNKHKPSQIKYGDFNFLLYLADQLDI